MPLDEATGPERRGIGRLCALDAQKPLTREELTMYTGWARDAITDGIRRLGIIGAIVDGADTAAGSWPQTGNSPPAPFVPGQRGRRQFADNEEKAKIALTTYARSTLTTTTS